MSLETEEWERTSRVVVGDAWACSEAIARSARKRVYPLLFTLTWFEVRRYQLGPFGSGPIRTFLREKSEQLPSCGASACDVKVREYLRI